MSFEHITTEPEGDRHVLASNRDSVEMGRSTPWNHPDEGDQEPRLGGGADGPNSANERIAIQASTESSSGQDPITNDDITSRSGSDTEGEAQVESSQSSSPADTPNSEGREGEDSNASLCNSDHATPTAALQPSHQPQPTSGVQTFVQPHRCTSAPPRLPGYDPKPRRPTDDDFSIGSPVASSGQGNVDERSPPSLETASGPTLFDSKSGADESNRAFEEDSSERVPRLRFPPTYADTKKAWQLWIAKARRNKEKRLRVSWWCGISHDTIDDLMVVPASLVKRRARPGRSKSF